MKFSLPVDGFRLAYDRVGSGPPVILLHGWPGDRTDYRDLVPLLAGSAELIVPDDVCLEMLDGVGHYTPLEAPEQLALAIQKRLVATARS